MYNTLKGLIDQYIIENTSGEITGEILNNILNQMVSVLGSGSKFKGSIQPDSEAPSGTEGENDYFYIATSVGTYTNFGDITVSAGELAFVKKEDSSWVKYSWDISSLLSGKQDTISDLATIRSGASAGATAYQKPQSGIPKTDLASDVQTSLGKADTALQHHQDISGKADKSDTYTKSEVDAKVTSVMRYKGSVNNYAALSAIQNPSVGDVYNVLDTGHNYAYDGTSWDVLSGIVSVDGKADKVSNATNGNFAGLDANGNITDSGKKASDFATAAQGTKADTALQSFTETDPTVPSWAKQPNKPSYAYSEIGNTPDLSGFITKSVNDLTNYYLKSETYTKAEVDEKMVRVYKPAGNATLATLGSLDASHEGFTYNMTEGFTTTADFIEGAGKDYPAGSNVAIVNAGTAQQPVYKYDVMGGGEEGTSNYNELTNKPQINGVTLDGNKTAEQLNLQSKIVEKRSTNLYDYRSTGCLDETYMTQTQDKNLRYYTNSIYNVSDYIPVSAGQNYSAAKCHDFAFFDENKTYIVDSHSLSSNMSDTKFTAPTGAAYVRVTMKKDDNGISNRVNMGDTLLPYEPFEAGTKLNLPLYALPNGHQLDSLIGKHTLSNKTSEMLSGSTLTIGDFPRFIQQFNTIHFRASFSSFSGATLKVGKGFDTTPTFGASWFEIGDGHIKMYAYNGVNQEIFSAEHELTLDTFIDVLIQQRSNDVYVAINTLDGFYQNTINRIGGFAGEVKAEITSTSLADCSITASNKSGRSTVWMFGDSYFGLSANARVGYWLKEWGVTDNVMFQFYSGQGSASAKQDFVRAVDCFGAPKFIVWGLGMNDDNSQDLEYIEDGNWYSYLQEVLELCRRNEIIPILATVPQVRSSSYKNKDLISAWVRESGFRYVDIANAVGSNANGEWYGNGKAYDYQASDDVHPTQYGARAIAMAYVSEASEITQSDGQDDIHSIEKQVDEMQTALQGKADNTAIVNIVGSTATQELANNTIYNAGELTALTITLPSTIEIDYISQINFTSGSTATQLTAPVTIVWDGDSINTDGEFEPEANMRYTVMLYSDGTNVLGIVRGTAIPTTQSNNE